MIKIGYTHGRYQPFHKGHLPIMLYILNKYDELWIGISNPDCKLPDNIDEYDEELQASIRKARDAKKNIFSFEQRKQMILESLKDEEVDLNRVTIKPHYGYYESNDWQDYFPPKEQTTIVLHNKDIHHDAKVEEYKKNGWQVELIPILADGYSGTKFHQVYPDGDWQSMVPEGTIRVINNMK